MKLVLPMPPNAANSRRHWRVVLNDKKAYWKECDVRMLVAYLNERAGKESSLDQPPEVPLERARIAVTMYLGNYMDPDNAMARLKPMCDWLKNTGYITDDNRKHLEWAGLPEQHIDRKSPRVEITITAL